MSMGSIILHIILHWCFCLLFFLRWNATTFVTALQEVTPPSRFSAQDLGHSNTYSESRKLRNRGLLSAPQVPLDFSRCDESKCISSGPEAIVNRTGQTGAGSLVRGNNTSYDLHRFDCYYKPNSNDALLCAEGYTGIPIDTALEPPRMIASPLFYYGIPVEQNYYTCCPPNKDNQVSLESSPPQIVRRCGDPKRVLLESDLTNSNSSFFDPMPCNDEENGRIFPRAMKESMPFYPDTYVCCEEDLGATEEEEITTTQNNPKDDLVDSVCDESRCIGRSVGEFLPGYSCWAEGPNNLNPFACSDGYVGIPVDSEPPFFDEGQFLRYYTCCPPSYATTITDVANNSTVQHRHCSDPINYEPNQDEIICNDPILQYPRKQNKNGHFWHSLRNPNVTTETYICCDVELQTHQSQKQPPNQNSSAVIIDSSESFLDQVDCVMSCDPDFQYDCWAENKYGFLWPMGCDDPNGEFVEPKILGNGYAMGGRRFFYRYGCCRKGFGTGPFIQDDAFNKTVWPQLILSVLGVLASLLLIIALLCSFFYGDTDGTNAPATKITTSSIPTKITASSTAISSRSRILSVPRSIFRSLTASEHRSTRYRSTRSTRRKDNANGGYNAYLIYLAIPDIILNLFVVGMYASYVNQTFVPGFSSYIVNSIFYERKTAFDMALILACSAANLYLNAIISYELFTLLKNSHRRLRTPPPTFKRVGLQALVVYLWAICIFLIRYFTEDSETIPMWLEVTLYFMISAGIPILYLCYVCIVIWRQKLLPSMKGPLRVLALYFFRIIAVFLLMWLPGVLLLSFACNWEWDNTGDVDYNDLLYPIGLIFCSIQPILSTGMALTKPDVQVAVWRLLGCWYCRQEEELGLETGGIERIAEDPKTKVEIAGEQDKVLAPKTSVTNSSIIVSSD